MEKLTELEGQLDKFRSVKLALTGATGKIDEARFGLEELEGAIKEKLSELVSMIKSGES